MVVRILKEIKTEENRVCMTPAGVEVIKANGQSVLVEKDARSGFDDAIYTKAGAEAFGLETRSIDSLLYRS